MDMDISANRVYVYLCMGPSWEDITRAINVLDFRGRVRSSYTLNLPADVYPWMLRSSRNGQVYLIADSDEGSYIMSMGRLR
jgi:hypothetical protein